MIPATGAARRPIRIAVVNTHPIQYFAPLYAALNRVDDLEITALYLSDFSLRGAHDRDFGKAVTWDVDLLAGYESRFIGKNLGTIEPYGFFSTISPEIFAEISPKRYDALWIHGHGYAAKMIALAAGRLKGVPVFMRGETHLGLGISRAKAAARRIMMGALYRQCAGLLAIGAANRDFYRAMGVDDKRISLVPYTVDNDRFIAAARITPGEREDWRKRLGIEDDAPIILFASKFQGRKRPGDLLKAFLQLRRDGLDAHLVMVGSGELEVELHQLASDAGDRNVHFPGFFNQSDLPRVYAASELFVLPSENEPWGLIVNEVMCAGLPVIVAQEVGCVRDLVQDGVNGATYPSGDIGALAAAIRSVLADPVKRMAMGAASRRIIDHWSYRECLDGIREALAKARITRATS